MAPRALLSALPKGYAFPTTTLQLSIDTVSRYLREVEDPNPVYLEANLAPPLAVAARALGSLLEAIELPAGALHTGQEIEMHAGVPLEAALTLSAYIAQRSERAGFVLSVIEFALTPAGASSPALTGRTTLAAPSNAGGAPS